MEKLQESPILALQKQRQLLQIEYEAEKEAFRKQTEETWWRLVSAVDGQELL